MDFNDRELVDNTDVMKLVSRVCYLGEDERKMVFNIPFVRDKLRRELLKTCNEGAVSYTHLTLPTNSRV